MCLLPHFNCRFHLHIFLTISVYPFQENEGRNLLFIHLIIFICTSERQLFCLPGLKQLPQADIYDISFYCHGLTHSNLYNDCWNCYGNNKRVQKQSFKQNSPGSNQERNQMKLVVFIFLYIHTHTHIALSDTHRNCKVTPCYIFYRLIHTTPHPQSFIAGFLRLRTHTSEVKKKKKIDMLLSHMCQNAAISSNFKNPEQFKPECIPTFYERSWVRGSSLHDMK